MRHQYGPWNPQDVEYFVSLTKRTRCQLAMNIMPRVLRPEEFRRRAHALYSAGVEYLALWDCDQRNELSSSWEGLARLGHRQEIESWVKAGGPDLRRPQCDGAGTFGIEEVPIH